MADCNWSITSLYSLAIENRVWFCLTTLLGC